MAQCDTLLANAASLTTDLNESDLDDMPLHQCVAYHTSLASERASNCSPEVRPGVPILKVLACDESTYVETGELWYIVQWEMKQAQKLRQYRVETLWPLAKATHPLVIAYHKDHPLPMRPIAVVDHDDTWFNKKGVSWYTFRFPPDAPHELRAFRATDLFPIKKDQHPLIVEWHQRHPLPGVEPAAKKT